MLIRAILPDWARTESPHLSKVVEGERSEIEITALSAACYNVYFFPNYPSCYTAGTSVDGSQVDTFTCVFVDMDLKDKHYGSKQEFIDKVRTVFLTPSTIVDSGNGIHVYWDVSDLDAMSFLMLQRRLCRFFNTDEAVSKICQLMRLTQTLNTKNPEDLKLCHTISTDFAQYSCEQLDKVLPRITPKDEEYCKNHFNKTYELQSETQVNDKLPAKFGTMLRKNPELKAIWTYSGEDRSGNDYKLGHLLFAEGFSRDDALSVLVNVNKALGRLPKHRIAYATNIVDKIWTYELEDKPRLSASVAEILNRGDSVTKGTRFPCHKLLDDTIAGFKLGQVIGLVAGSGVGKTSMALNMFKWFTELNPEYDHFFVSLEQTDNEIAERWKTMCGEETRLHKKVHILSNYNDKGEFRHLSLDDIKEYILDFQKDTGKKIGTCVIDHIGALRKQSKNGENQAIMDICHQMKSFAIETNTMVIMQSQAPREKAGIGDLELNKDAAYGTVFFESYVDYLLCIWQPLKRMYSQGAPTIMAFKYAKIRHKKQGKDKIQEDVCYRMMFDPESERLREVTQAEETSFKYFQTSCINLRKMDRKTDVVIYQSRRVENEPTPTDSNKNSSGDETTGGVH